MLVYSGRRTIKIFSLFMALVLLALCAMPVLAGASGGNPSAGANEYVSLHKYATRTDEPGVYKVRLDISNNQNVNVEPIFITFVLDASPSMYLSRLTDDPSVIGTSYPRMPTADPLADRVSRWEGAWAGLRAALDIFGDPVENPAYEHTYISIVAFDGYSSRVFSNTAKQGWYFEKIAGNGSVKKSVYLAMGSYADTLYGKTAQRQWRRLTARLIPLTEAAAL